MTILWIFLLGSKHTQKYVEGIIAVDGGHMFAI